MDEVLVCIDRGVRPAGGLVCIDGVSDLLKVWFA